MVGEKAYIYHHKISCTKHRDIVPNFNKKNMVYRGENIIYLLENQLRRNRSTPKRP